MTSIPSNLSRMPDILRTMSAVRAIGRTNADLLRVQQQIASGLDLLRPSDDIVRASAVSILDERLERSEQLQRNLSHADAALNVLDSLLGEAHDAALNAKSIASQQMTSTAGPTERRAQATIIDQILAGMLNTANRQSVAGYALGGSQTSRAPVERFLSGYRFAPSGPGLVSDLGQAATIPITLGAGNPLVNTASRAGSQADLNPALSPDTRLIDLDGARGLGVAPGSVRVLINATDSIDADLTGADSVRDVLARIHAAIRAYENDTSTTVLGPGGVGTSGGSITFDLAGAATLRFLEVGPGTTARDLGLASDVPFDFSSSNPAGSDANPRLTERSTIASLAGLSGPLGSIRVSNAGRSAVIDLSSAQTIGDLRRLVEGAGMGVRVRVNDNGTGIDVLNDVAAASNLALSISEVADDTATRLGIRTMNAGTRLSDFNFGRGVGIVDAQNDPTTNTPTPALNTDLRITLGDSGSTEIDVDLRPQDLATVQTLLDRLNSEIAAGLSAAGLPAGSLVASLNPTDNGLRLTQSASFPGVLRVAPRNNSPAAEQLGLLNGTYDASSASLVGEDRAKVRVESVFTNLLDLRDALLRDDSRGMSLAAADLDASIAGLADVRGLVGGYAQRVEQATVRETDRSTMDTQIRSNLRDTDFSRAASRLSLLQVQLQASLQVTAAISSRTLLDFLS